MAYKTVQLIFVTKLLKNIVFDLGFFQFSLQPGFLFDKNFAKESDYLPKIFYKIGLCQKERTSILVLTFHTVPFAAAHIYNYILDYKPSELRINRYVLKWP